MTRETIKLPPSVADAIGRLEARGHEAYAVGGCVRDAVLGREPADWDITTSASPYEVKALFSRTIDTGLQHGTVTVMLGKEGFEVEKPVYEKECFKHTCEKVGDSYFGKDGKADGRRLALVRRHQRRHPGLGLISH